MSQDKFIYLDNSATTYTDPRVIEDMLPYFGEIYGNASSQHFMGRKALKATTGQSRALLNPKPTRASI